MNAARLPSRRRSTLLVVASAILVAGCSGAAAPATPTAAAGSPGAATAAPSAPSGRPSDLPLQTPPLATVPPSAQPIVGEAPAAIVAAARVDLAARIPAAPAAAAAVVRSEAVAWPDGSLGCPVRGELYPQVITPGYWIVLATGGEEYDYRATEDGAVRLCERALTPNPGG